jgi:hypothetical protein
MDFIDVNEIGGQSVLGVCDAGQNFVDGTIVVLKGSGRSEYTLLSQSGDQLGVVLNHVLTVAEVVGRLLYVSGTAIILRSLFLVNKEHDQRDDGTKGRRFTVLAWDVDEALTIPAKISDFMLPAEQVGVDR